MKRFCVYSITCLSTGKTYVGKANDAAARWQHHRADARRDEPQSLIGRAIRKHGLANFRFEVLETYDTEAEALWWESWWIRYLGTTSPLGYNLSAGGDGPSWHPSSREKMSRSRKGETHSPEWNAKVAAALRGKSNGPLAGRRATGWKLSEETRAKMSASRLGKARPVGATDAAAATRRGRPLTDEQKQKISATLKGRTLDPIAHEKFLAAMSSPEVRAKMRAAWERRRQRKATELAP